MTLSILLPAVSPCTSHDACEKYVENLLSAIQDFLQNNPASNVICGIDAHDSASEILADKLAASTNRLRTQNALPAPLVGIYCGGLIAYIVRIRSLFLRTSGSSGVIDGFLA